MEQYKYRKCDACNGTSFEWDVPSFEAGDGICSDCRGTGHDESWPSKMIENWFHLSSSPCLTCKGSKQCQKCGGKGLFTNKKHVESDYISSVAESHPSSDDNEEPENDSEELEEAEMEEQWSYSSPEQNSTERSTGEKFIDSLSLFLRSLMWSLVIALPLQWVSAIIISIFTGTEPRDGHYSVFAYGPPMIFLLVNGIGVFLAIREWLKK
jgi:hypothetical protein